MTHRRSPMQSRRISPRIVTCLSLSLLCPALLSGCSEGKNCIAEEAEDYELNEIFFDLSVAEHRIHQIEVKFAMYAHNFSAGSVAFTSDGYAMYYMGKNPQI